MEVTGYDASTQTYTVWVRATADNSSSNNWSTNIARLKYTVTGNTSVTPTAITITNLEGAIGQTDGSNRTAVSVAENDNRICFCTRLGSATGNWYYIVYSLSDLNNVLDTKQNGTSHTLSSLNLTIKSTFSLTGSGLPNNSFQAIDNDGVGSGNKYLYISGGKVNEDGIIDQYLYTNGGNVSKNVTYIFHTTTIPTGLCDDIDFLRGAEIEGIKIYTVSGTDYMYIMFRKNATDKEARVYSYPIIYPTT